MDAKFNYGEKVRVLKNIRNDGTFMGAVRGALLVRHGSEGYIKGVGKFLQEQMIYQVHFIEQGYTVGCRESELGDLSQPWVDRQFDRGDKVNVTTALSSDGEVVVKAGDMGTILSLESHQQPYCYNVSFQEKNGLKVHSWLIPETVLTLASAIQFNDLLQQERSTC